MLSSIHPFGERSRNNAFSQTAAAHVLGSILGGLALGLVAGGVGVVLLSVVSIPVEVRTGLIVAVAGVATILEATKRERLFPTRTRQVNENWIQNYRGWVYGGGFGAELGFGISTIITTTLIHVLVLAMVLLGNLGAALILGALFGAVRGATVLAAAGVDSPEQLRNFHQRLDQLRSRSRAGAVVSLATATAIGLAAISGIGAI